jgi:two-component system NtrC family sensor kinase
MMEKENSKPVRPKLLIVDDEVAFLRSTARIFEKRGYEVDVAASGEEALSKLGGQTFDVVVLDVKMPGIDGMETLKIIKDQHPDMEVILLTGHASTRNGVDGIKFGAFDYLAKPLEIEHLIRKVMQAHEKKTRRREKQREKEYRRQMEQNMSATERLASLGTLATGVAHEINNPLAIIRESAGWMDMVLDQAENARHPAAADLKNALVKIQTAVDRATRITHQLLGFVRTPSMVPVETDLKELAEEAIDLICRTVSGDSIEFAIHAGTGSTVLRSDPHRLRQVLINLVNNAVYAVSPAGSISVSIDPGETDILLSVSDNGVGISEEHLEKIFEPFFSTKPQTQGTGLGLFVTRGIVERLGGRIDVASRPGQGARFSVRLPRDYSFRAENPSPAPHWIETIQKQF